VNEERKRADGLLLLVEDKGTPRQVRSHALIAEAFQAGSCATAVTPARDTSAATIHLELFIGLLSEVSLAEPDDRLQ
jgi:hypothetical protein